MKRNKLVLIVSIVTMLSMLAFIIPVIPVLAATSITLSPSSGPVGSTIVISGTEFHSSPAQILVDSVGIAANVPLTLSGSLYSLYTGITVPALPKGPHIISVITASDSVSANFIITPNMTLSTYSGPAGNQITFQGSGFTANQNYSVTFGTLSPYITATSNAGIVGATGVFSGALSIPNYPAGPYSVTLATFFDTATVTFTITAGMALSATSGNVGSQVTVTGNGFIASGSASVYLDNNVVQTTTTNNNGSIAGLAVTIPETAGGSHVIKVTDTSGNSASSAFTVIPKLTVSSTNLAPGTNQVTVSGTGFVASSTVNFTLDNAPVTAVINAGANGSFASTVITLPSISAGIHVLKATDSSGRSDSANISTSSSISVSPQSGTVGSQVTVTGIGFAANKTITLTYNSTTVTVSPPPIADTNGKFTAAFTVPNLASATYVIQASDGTGIASANFTSSATPVTGGANGGVVGTDIPIAGNGFTANSTISIKYDTTTIATTKADANGSFSTTFKLPASKPGAHTVIATDGVN
jgi:hypothetical protein